MMQFLRLLLLLGTNIFYSILLHCRSAVKMLQKLYQQIFTKFGALSMHMTQLLIGSAFKDLGRVPICTICNACSVALHQAMICQRLASSGWRDQHLGTASAYVLFIRSMKQCRGQSGWCKELPQIATTNLLHGGSFQEAASYTLGLIVSSSLLLHHEVFLNALSISHSHFLAEPQ